MLCTLTTPDCGTITWDGKDIFKMGASYRQILGYLPQDFGYYPYLTIYDYMMYIAAIKGIRPAVVALIAAPTFTMGRSAKINRHNLWIPVVSALLIWLLGFSPIWIIIAAGVGGFLWGKFRKVES